MKAKILLLSLATLLLVAFQSCSNEIEPTLLSIQNSESMETKTEIVSGTKAGMLQINAERFNCQIIELGLVAGGNARISVKGTADDLQALFDYVNEAGAQ